MACPYLTGTDEGYHCRILQRRVSIMLRPCLRDYERCPIYRAIHPRLKVLFRCLTHSLPLEGFETERLLEDLRAKRLPWEAKSCEECACYSERYDMCLYDLVKHKGRCPVKEFLREATKK